MIGKNLKYYRLMRSFSQKSLAEKVGVTPMTISHYESDSRMPDMATLKKLADALCVSAADLLASRNEELDIQHNEFRKNAALTKSGQEFAMASAEEYFNRFMTVVNILGGTVLSASPRCYELPISGNSETDAEFLRQSLGFASSGPIENLTGQLENKGFLIYVNNEGKSDFFGLNGFVNSRPYIMVRGNVTTERLRSTLVHELSHLMFNWEGTGMDEKEMEKYATAISGAFLFPAMDAIRELGVRRSGITADMIGVAREYGISMLMLAQRACELNIVSKEAVRHFYIHVANPKGWRKHEPSRIAAESMTLHEQLVCRAVSEDEISIQRGAELLKISYDEMAHRCDMDKE